MSPALPARARRVGYALLVAALTLMIAGRSGVMTHLGPVPVGAIALILLAIGVMLVFTELMVRGLYAEIAARGAVEDAKSRPHD